MNFPPPLDINNYTFMCLLEVLDLNLVLLASDQVNYTSNTSNDTPTSHEMNVCICGPLLQRSRGNF